MTKEEFTKKMLAAGRGVMIAKLGEWFGAVGTDSTETMDDAELVDVMWGLYRISQEQPIAA